MDRDGQHLGMPCHNRFKHRPDTLDVISMNENRCVHRQGLTQLGASQHIRGPAVRYQAENCGQYYDTRQQQGLRDRDLCFDWKKSTFDTPPYDDHRIAGVQKLVILEAALRGMDLVRMAEIPSLLLVSNRLRELIEGVPLIGIGFQDISDFEKF